MISDRCSERHLKPITRCPYPPYGELEPHREAMARFGTGMKANHAIP